MLNVKLSVFYHTGNPDESKISTYGGLFIFCNTESYDGSQCVLYKYCALENISVEDVAKYFTFVIMQ